MDVCKYNKYPSGYKSKVVTPESKNEVGVSKFPVAESNSSDESNLNVLSINYCSIC
jgi:hypothetical protein